MLAEFQEIKEIKSISRAGMSTVAIELLDAIDETEPIWTEMRDDLAALRAELPLARSSPSSWSSSSPRTPGSSASPGTSTARRSAGSSAASPRTWRMNFARSPGPTTWWSAALGGGLIELDPGRLAAAGLDATSVSSAILASDAKVAGEIVGAGQELQLEVSGALDSLARIGDVLVDRGDGADSFVRVADLGRVTKGERLPHTDLAFVDGEPGVVVAARMETGRRVDVVESRPCSPT